MTLNLFFCMSIFLQSVSSLEDVTCMINLISYQFGHHFPNYVRLLLIYIFEKIARHAGSDSRMSASGSAGLGSNPRRGSKFSFENFQPRG